MAELHELTLADAASAVASGDACAAELVESTLARIEASEGKLHAYARVLADAARATAAARDRERARGRLRGPLHGVPVAVKDLCDVRGAPTEAGSRVLAGRTPAAASATVVERLEAAGAIVVGKTVTHEFAWGVNAPPTRSPWAPGAYPGGSSAGSAVAVAARSSFGAIGTDSGGSIRIPAAINLLVGLKPTFGRVSRHGIVPMSPTLDHPGPLTRSVADAALMLQVIAGRDPRDPQSLSDAVPDYGRGLEAGARGLVIGVERGHHFGPRVAGDVAARVEEAIAAYRSLGAVVVDVQLPEFELMSDVGMTILLGDTSAWHRRLLRAHAADYDDATRALLQLGELLPATHYVLAQRARRLLGERVRHAFARHRLDALLWPTLPLTTVSLADVGRPRTDFPTETPMGSYVAHTFSGNVLGLPALSVPCGRTDAGLPVGLQLLGRPLDEPTLLRLARAYEREHDWCRLMPPGVEAIDRACDKEEREQ